MKKIIPVSGMLALLCFFSCQTHNEHTAAPFQGMWKLHKFESFDSVSGKWMDDKTRTGWEGYILYDGLGHMGVHLVPSWYRDFDPGRNIDSLQLDELKQLVGFYRSNFVYFADYSTEGSSIEHHRLSATEPSNWGNTLTRDFEFRGDTLILAAREDIRGLKIRLRWIRY